MSGAPHPALLTLAEALDMAPRPSLVWGDSLTGLERHDRLTDQLEIGRAAGCPVGVVPAGDLPVERIALLMPRAKAALAMRLRLAAARLPAGGELWVAGHRRDGVRSATSRLEAVAGAATVVHLKRRCRVLSATLAGPGPPAPLLDFESRHEVDAAGTPLSLVSLPGVFGHGRLDLGSRHLLGVLDAASPRYRRALDLGAGCGVLGAWLARRSKRARVELLDVSATACEASRRTLAANGLDATVHLALADDLPAAAYDLVVSNPPRHEGRAHAHHRTAEAIAAAARRLSRGGRFFCVANHNREVTAALEAHFHRVNVRFHDGSYRVWEAVRLIHAWVSARISCGPLASRCER